MQELLLRQSIFGLVTSGKKTSTSRKGKRDITKGLLLFKMTEDETVQTVVNVTDVKFVEYKDLTDTEAKKEGYERLEELKAVLNKIYGDIPENEIFTLIEWE